VSALLPHTVRNGTMQTQPTLAVANYFIAKAQSEGRPITPMQLIKLVYIAHGWTLGLYDRPLIGEDVQAWQYGPVIPSIYHEFKHYGRNPISQQKAIATDQGELFIPTVNDRHACRVLDRVWEVYGHLSGLQLSSITHQPGTPWYEEWYNGGGERFRDNVLSQANIARYYNKLAATKQ